MVEVVWVAEMEAVATEVQAVATKVALRAMAWRAVARAAAEAS